MYMHDQRPSLGCRSFPWWLLVALSLSLALFAVRAAVLTPLRVDAFCFWTRLVTMNPFLRPTAMPDMVAGGVGARRNKQTIN